MFSPSFEVNLKVEIMCCVSSEVIGAEPHGHGKTLSLAPIKRAEISKQHFLVGSQLFSDLIMLIRKLILSVWIVSSSGHKSQKRIADTLRQFMLAYFSHYRAGY